MTEITEPAAFRADRIRSAHKSHLCSREDAIRQIIDAYDGGVTEIGAANLLDHSTVPSQRRADCAGAGKSRHAYDMLMRDCGENA